MSNELENEAQPQRWWDLPSALLLLAAMLTASSRLVATHWTIELALTETLAFFGCIAGLAAQCSIVQGEKSPVID